MKANCRRIESPQRDGIAQVVEEQSRLMRDAIKRYGFDAQAGFFRRAVTSSFRGSQFSLCSCLSILRGTCRLYQQADLLAVFQLISSHFNLNSPRTCQGANSSRTKTDASGIAEALSSRLVISMIASLPGDRS